MDKPISTNYAQELMNEQAKHDAEKQAIIEEFTNKLKEEWSADDIKEKLEQLMPQAYSSLRYLIEHAESESVRASLIRYIFNIALQQLAPPGENDPDNALQKLLEELKQN